MLGQDLTRNMEIALDTTCPARAGEMSDQSGKIENSLHVVNSLYQVKGRVHTLPNGKKFVYLPYSPGQINYVETELDVISSRFSGCVMAKFEMKGKVCVAHVATPECHAGWIRQKKQIKLICEFTPSNFRKKQLDTKVAGKAFKEARESTTNPANAPSSDCFGIIDADNKMYAGYLQSTKTPGIVTRHKIHSCIHISR